MSLAADVQTLQQADAALAAAGPAPFHLPATGLEACIAGALAGLERGDWWVPGLRERVGAVLRDVPVERLVDGFQGARPYKVAPPTASPALRALHAVGLAVGSGKPTLVHLGIGSVSDGAFTEALNLAALQAACVILLVAEHPLDGQAPVGPQTAASATALAAAYGLTTHTVDGTDPVAVRDAVAAARAAGGPHLIAASLAGAA